MTSTRVGRQRDAPPVARAHGLRESAHHAPPHDPGVLNKGLGSIGRGIPGVTLAVCE
jgi:hypothetical protein